uniref:DNA topoisomerase 1 n=1 Tax=Eiseniibacteriota bacterium TaxID=2212470 RepID=A0A832MK08_UNCEI
MARSTSRTEGGARGTAGSAARAGRATGAVAPRARRRAPAAASAADADAPAAAPRAARRAPKRAAAPRAEARRRAAPAVEEATDGGAPSVAGKALVIVESPTKSKTLGKFLGRGFSVMASNGHIMDLPKSKLGVDIENDFEPEYEPIRSKNQALARLKAAARAAERIYLAPDPDREGEAIAYHLAQALKPARKPMLRLTFNEITERAVKQALAQPRELDMNLVNAQQARRVLDRLVGYKVSPLLWKVFYFGLSAGRVQSVALRLLAEREDEIERFVPVEYWTLEADFETARAERFTARLVRVAGEDLEQGQLRGEGAGARAAELARELERSAARVTGVQTAPRQVHPRPPFITSTLQQTAFNRLGFTSQRTMKIAQQLYEGVTLGREGSVGLITYMRTDSPRLAGEAIAEMRAWLAARLGADYVPESPRQFRGKKGAQEAHEAIRPTSVERTPEALRAHLTEEQWKLYDLIWKRAMASQAAPAEYLATTVEIEAGRLGMRASGRVLKFPGFQKLYGMDEEDDAAEARLPELAAGEPLSLAREAVVAEAGVVRPEQHFTQPPPRYTEASLVKALEEENIGRPSTYASIVGTITARQYVTRDRGRLVPTDLGRTVVRVLVEEFPDVFDVKFTAGMEDELDGIEEGVQEWHRVVGDLWRPLSKDLARAEKDVARLRGLVQAPTDVVCPRSGHRLVRKFGRRGAFLACPGYPECKYTRPVEEQEMPQPVEGTCETCGSALVVRTGPYGRFISCARYPECRYTRRVTLGIKCPKCGEGEIVEKRSKRGKVFFSCTRYPACDFAAWDRPVARPCPNCGAAFLVRKETKKGASLRCLTCRMSFPSDESGA